MIQEYTQESWINEIDDIDSFLDMLVEVNQSAPANSLSLDEFSQSIRYSNPYSKMTVISLYGNSSLTAIDTSVFSEFLDDLVKEHSSYNACRIVTKYSLSTKYAVKVNILQQDNLKVAA